MNRYLTIASLLVFVATEALGQRSRSIAVMPGRVATTEIQTMPQSMIYALPDRSGAMRKTSFSGERLIAQTVYYDPSKPGATFDDSLVLKYSDGRGSAFDFDNLQYDFENENDVPGLYKRTGYVNFDTAHSYFPSAGPINYLLRTYGSNGKVTSVQEKTILNLYTYDAQGRVATKSTVWPSGDTLQRNFYVYNLAGLLVADSTHELNQTTREWMIMGATTYTYDAAGNVTQQLLTDHSTYSTSNMIYKIDVSYNSANLPISITKRFHLGNGIFENGYKDTFGYMGNTRVMSKSYGWDGAIGKWNLTSEEHRHLNSASLPDSVWFHYNYFSRPKFDTAYYKLVYNAQGNPIFRSDHGNNNQEVTFEIRWYYESDNSLSATAALVNNDLRIYPNPAGEVLYLKGITEGRYTIQNMAGQILQTGAISSTGISLCSITPGAYIICVQDKNGVHTTRFIRR